MVLAGRSVSGTLLAAAVAYGLISDIYDGVLTRRWNTATPSLRVSDSLADTVFYIGVTVTVWLRVPQAILGNKFLLGSLIAFELLRHVFDLFKFRRMASYHSYLAKAWGLLLALAVMLLFVTGNSGMVIKAALWTGIVCNAEGLLMSLLLAKWHHDVRHLWAARELAKADGAFDRMAAGIRS